jgi:hypothetical protein
MHHQRAAPARAPGGARKAQQLPQPRDAALLGRPHPHQPVGVLDRDLEAVGVAAGEADLRRPWLRGRGAVGYTRGRGGGCAARRSSESAAATRRRRHGGRGGLLAQTRRPPTWLNSSISSETLTPSAVDMNSTPSCLKSSSLLLIEGGGTTPGRRSLTHDVGVYLLLPSLSLLAAAVHEKGYCIGMGFSD